MLSVFLSGKMGTHWRRNTTSLEGRDQSFAGTVIHPKWYPATLFEYAGPIIPGDDHGGYHYLAETGREDPNAGSVYPVDGMLEVEGTPSTIVALNFSQIYQSDAIIAYINTPDCYGTLVEVGLASGLRKKVVVILGDEMKTKLTPAEDRALTKECDTSEDVNDAEDAYQYYIDAARDLCPGLDLWFVLEAANFYYTDVPALDLHHFLHESIVRLMSRVPVAPWTKHRDIITARWRSK